MADEDAKVSYPYMTATQWFGIRAKLRQSVPKAIDVDWVMSALGTSEKGARNILPQLRAVGLIAADNSPSELALDLRDDDAYPEAARRALESLYPQSLRDAYNDPSVEFGKVAPWFMRNAKTGELTANMQAKLYLTLLKGELPGPDELKPAAQRKKQDTVTSERKPRSSDRAKTNTDKNPADMSGGAGGGGDAGSAGGAGGGNGNASGPTLHLDLQIHIAADAGADQIDAVFKSMAKHLYGR